MVQKYPSVKINLSQNEKNILEEKAKERHMSVSSFVKSELSHLFLSSEMITPQYEYEAECRDVRIEFRVSEREAKHIQANAGNRSIASYVRDAALNGSKVIRVEVYDDDILELSKKIMPKLDRIFDVFKFLQLQEKLHDVQYNRLEELLNSISEDIRETMRIYRKHRNSLKQSQLRELRKRCQKSVKTETDSLACFYNDDNEEI